MKKNKRVAVTILFLIIALAIVGGTAASTYRMKRKECFERLISYTEQIGRQIRTTMETDQVYLKRFSEQIAGYDMGDTEALVKELEIRENIGLISSLELLLPGDHLLLGDGTVLDVSGQLSYEALAAAGSSVSRRSKDIQDPEKWILRSCVPVIQDGKTVAVLCGVIDLEHMPNQFYIHEYDNNFNVMVVEAETGDFLQDTWHSELGNTDDLGERQTKPGYSWETFRERVARQEASSMIFLSVSAGEYFYAYAAPVGIADWMVTVNVLESVIFAPTRKLMHLFLVAAVMLALLFGAYFIWSLQDVKRENTIKEKRLCNVSYMLDVGQKLFDAHIYPEHFVLALERIAEYLSAEQVFLWQIEEYGEDSMQYWSCGSPLFVTDTESFKRHYPGIFGKLREHGEFNFHGAGAILRQFPAEGKLLLEKNIDNMMLVSVNGEHGGMMYVLGACNLAHAWDTTEPLTQVVLSFSMALNHYKAYRTLDRMGHIDSMTGLMNRNSYHEALDRMEEADQASIGCVYIDVNGLHEINNHLGHQAGDEMLCAVAEKLRKYFSGERLYRIGGDEFVVFCKDWTEQHVILVVEQVRAELKDQGYELSVGIVWKEGAFRLDEVVDLAEENMREDKKRFYQRSGKERRRR